MSKYLLGLLTFAVASFAVAIYIQNTVKAEAEPDLSPSTNNASPSDVMWGEQISYTYTLINSGNADGTGMDVYSTLAAGTSNPANFTFTNCGGSVQNTSASSYVELANVTTTMAQNCIVTFEVTVDNPYSGDGTIVNDYRISPAAEGGAEVGPLTANVTTVLSVCGNTILEAEEECDDGNTTDGDGCSSQCTVEAACGDGNVDSGEACDDGNTSNGDGCSSQCEIEPMCGDGNVDNGEECDDDNRTNGDGCSSQCEIEPMCGDGNIDAGEACDDGNTTDGDGCSSQCSDEAFCGDGTVDTGEACDDGNTLNGDGCSSQCTVEAACGDGKVDIGEECDDGNTTNGDGCSSACTIEQGECGECDGKITTLTLRYDGTETTNIEVEQDKGGIIFEDEISPGEVFTLNGVGKNGTLGTKIFIRESGDGNSCDDGGSKDGGSKDNDSSCSETEIHTSCSKEILVGMSFGNFVVVDGASLNGGPICLEEPDLFCPDEPVLIETEEIACWANEAVDWVIENELFSILDEEDVRDAVKFYRFYQFLQEQ